MKATVLLYGSSKQRGSGMMTGFSQSFLGSLIEGILTVAYADNIRIYAHKKDHICVRIIRICEMSIRPAGANIAEFASNLVM